MKHPALKATSFAFCVAALFFVGTAVVEAENSALVVNVATCDERSDIPEDDGFAAFLNRLSADGWNRWRIPEGNDATYENVVAVVDSFVSGIEADSDAMVAIKGRVVETDGVVYLLPSDAKTADGSLDESHEIPLEDVVGKLENTPAKRCFLAIDDRDGSETVADESFQRLAKPKVVVVRGKLSDVFDKINVGQSPQNGVDQEVPKCEETEPKDVGSENQPADVDGCSSDEPVSPPQCADSEDVDNNLTVKVVDDTIRLCSSSVLKEIANNIANEYEQGRFVIVPTFATDSEKRLNDSLLPLAERLARELDEDLSANGFSTKDFDEIQAVLAKNDVRLAPSPSDEEFEKMSAAIHDATDEIVDMVAYGRVELVENDNVDGVAVTVTVFEASSRRKKVFKGAFKADDCAKADVIGLSTTLSDDDTENGEYSLVMPTWDDIAEAETKQAVEELAKPALLDPEFDYHVSIRVRDTGVANSKWAPREIVQDGVENVLFLGKSETFAVCVQNKTDKNACARVVVDNKGTLPLNVDNKGTPPVNGKCCDFAPTVKDVMSERSWLIRSRTIGFIDGFYRFNNGKLAIGESVDTEDASFKLVNRTDANVEYYDVYPEKVGSIYVAVYETKPVVRKNELDKVSIVPDTTNVVRRQIKISDQVPKDDALIAVLNVRVKLPPED